MTEALFFDLNGVVVDDEEQHYEALRTVLAEEGIALSREGYDADYLGINDRTSLLKAFHRSRRALTPERLECLIAAKNQTYAALIERSLVLVPGCAQFVRAAAKRYRLGVVSGAWRHEIELVLARVGLRVPFEVIVAAEDVARCKPDPAGYLAARDALARERPLAARRCVVIEDSLPGLQAAHAAGMACVMLTTSHDRALFTAADLVWSSFEGHSPEELLHLAAS